MMERLGMIQEHVDRLLMGIENLFQRRCGYVHLYGVSYLATMLAMKRGINAELAAVAGMLHDVATYSSGSSQNHAVRGSLQAEQILIGTECFAPDEVEAICEAIARHSDKGAIHDPLSELLKDADVLQHWLHSPGNEQPTGRLARIRGLCEEFSLTPGEVRGQ